MLFSAVAVNLNKIGFNFCRRPALFINRITFSFRRNNTRSLLLYGATVLVVVNGPY